MIHLKKEERQILWKKYLRSGLCHEEANKKINDFVAYQNRLVITMKLKNKSPEEIKNKFNQSFWKLCQEIEC